MKHAAAAAKAMAHERIDGRVASAGGERDTVDSMLMPSLYLPTLKILKTRASRRTRRTARPPAPPPSASST